jgi:hypothetical protein
VTGLAESLGGTVESVVSGLRGDGAGRAADGRSVIERVGDGAQGIMQQAIDFAVMSKEFASYSATESWNGIKEAYQGGGILGVRRWYDDQAHQTKDILNDAKQGSSGLARFGLDALDHITPKNSAEAFSNVVSPLVGGTLVKEIAINAGLTAGVESYEQRYKGESITVGKNMSEATAAQAFSLTGGELLQHWTGGNSLPKGFIPDLGKEILTQALD